MMYHKTVKTYYYQFRSGYPDIPYVVLYGEDNNDIIGVLHFEPDDKPALSPRRYRNGYPVIYFYHRDMALIIDMLRNEGPVHLAYYTDTSNTIVTTFDIGTFMEPAGEGEL